MRDCEKEKRLHLEQSLDEFFQGESSSQSEARRDARIHFHDAMEFLADEVSGSEFSRDLLLRVSMGDEEAIRRCCALIAAELMIERKLRSENETHLVGRGKVMARSKLNYLVAFMLEALCRAQKPVPVDLVIVVRELSYKSSSNYFGLVGAHAAERLTYFIASFVAIKRKLNSSRLKKRSGSGMPSLGELAEYTKEKQRSTVIRRLKKRNFSEGSVDEAHKMIVQMQNDALKYIKGIMKK
jgi:hypothetical protein